VDLRSQRPRIHPRQPSRADGHRDHNHDNNPPDGGNWELLGLYCHDNEHQRQLEASGGGSRTTGGHSITHSSFANFKALLNGKKAP
jgi:hypothetical protein